VEIGGFGLPPATNVMFLPYIVQRDPRWFEDPDSFRPERWADGLAQRLPRLRTSRSAADRGFASASRSQ